MRPVKRPSIGVRAGHFMISKSGLTNLGAMRQEIAVPRNWRVSALKVSPDYERDSPREKAYQSFG